MNPGMSDTLNNSLNYRVCQGNPPTLAGDTTLNKNIELSFFKIHTTHNKQNTLTYTYLYMSDVMSKISKVIFLLK